ncbi:MULTISPECIES: hypothetical protein [Photorhabdus]|uniref:Uncharacterized protein n=1 Tax=Photorhabdus bodei TaxID=2029681 RepID=A0AAW6BKU4_9GAMM|nr:MULTISPECIES: hypothetical protein [Photorhabdus]MDB6372395.1 hypothetical protein [Photorhabdus bodei]
MTGVSECSQQRGNLKDNGYKCCKFIIGVEPIICCWCHSKNLSVF